MLIRTTDRIWVLPDISSDKEKGDGRYLIYKDQEAGLIGIICILSKKYNRY